MLFFLTILRAEKVIKLDSKKRVNTEFYFPL